MMVLLHVVNIYVYANVYTHESSTNAYALLRQMSTTSHV